MNVTTLLSIQKLRSHAMDAKLLKSSATNAGISGSERRIVAREDNIFYSITIFLNLELANPFYGTIQMYKM